MAISKNTLEHYLVQLRRIEEHREADAEREIRKIYKALLKDLKQFLGVEYADYAQDDKLTYEVLRAKGEYARFLEEVEIRINNFTPRAASEIRNTVEDTYKAAYQGMVTAVERSNSAAKLHENLEGIRAITPEIVKRAVENPISGLTLDDTLEKNRREVIYDIKQQIGIGLSQGDRMSTMARRITDRIDIDYRKATRIVRTEAHRVREAGYHDCANEIDDVLSSSDAVDMVMAKTWRTMKDEAVRPQRRARKGKNGKVSSKRKTLGGPNHMKMEGKTVALKEKFDLGGGVKTDAPGQSGVAGHDINCRCYLEYDLMTRDEFEKAVGRKTQQKGFTESAKSGIIKANNTYYTKDDPMREVFGSAFVSNPEEVEQIIKKCKDKGVEVVYKTGVMAYQPNPRKGKPGRLVIDKDASYSAWKHEERHVLDDEISNWSGFRNFMDIDKAVKFEVDAYDVEIELAKKYGLDDMVDRLEALKDERRRELLGE